MRKTLASRSAFALALLILLIPSGGLANGGDDDFRLSGTAQHALDPDNPANQIIRIDTATAPFFGTVSRRLNAKVNTLDHMLEFRSSFVAPRTCFAGIPRMTLLVDADGDGDWHQNTQPPDPASPDFAAHGHVNPPAYTACQQQPDWRYDDFTDSGMRWEVTPATAFPAIGNFPYDPWDTFENAVMTQLPNHQVCTGFLVDANEGSGLAQSGIAYYDLISIRDETWTEFDDTAGRGFAQGCRTAADDDDDDGENKNGKMDDDDNDNDPDGWESNDSALDAGSTSYGNNGVNGSKAVSITGNGRSAALSGSPSWTSAPFAVTPGSLLDLRVWTKSSGLSSAPTAGIDFLGPAGQVLSRVAVITAPLSTSAFEKLTDSVLVPAGVDRARVVLTGFAVTDLSTAGAVTFDNVGVFRSPLSR